jgi:hypothetical protein
MPDAASARDHCRIQDPESVKTPYDVIGIQQAAADEVKRSFERRRVVQLPSSFSIGCGAAISGTRSMDPP